ncbi:hypothetical protein [Enorma sp.]|uniref:hypothetical protein n=1 Tax=Enorma sp. TaxID=1920692 RepID=UPI0025C7257D|nr:hypothetical protein [Enorma sp.]
MATSEMAWKLFTWRDLGLRAAETPSEGRAAPGFADRGAAARRRGRRTRVDAFV